MSRAQHSPPSVGTLTAIDPAAITLPDWQRHPVDETVVEELAKSISAAGLLHPPIVRPHGDGYQLIAGRHRVEAMKQLGADRVMVIVKEADDRRAEIVSLIENLKRRVLTPAEKGAALARLHALMTGSAPANADQERAPRTSDGSAVTTITSTAKAAGASRTKTSRALTRQKKASPEVIAALDAEEIPLTTADELTKLSTAEQARILPQVKTMTRREVRNFVQTLRNAPPRVQPDRDEEFVAKVETFLEDVNMYVRDRVLSASASSALTKVKTRLDALLVSPATELPAEPAAALP
ncbi:MAG: ParB N-terminal domain-containing protein [Myxococcaceae bacterium]|nr:ParB N-terminal domain-containing protein [Myxococcaceae bacterium]